MLINGRRTSSISARASGMQKKNLYAAIIDFLWRIEIFHREIARNCAKNIFEL